MLKEVSRNPRISASAGNVTVIPWTVAAQRGPALATLNNKIIVQEDSYFVVYGQVPTAGQPSGPFQSSTQSKSYNYYNF
ncbi:hypothetical protein MHYP_G00106750 [Metynnis hypsauchen]